MKRTRFWLHYNQFLRLAMALEKDYSSAAEKVGENDEGFRRTWERIKTNKKAMVRPSRIPDFPEPDWDQYEPSCEDCDMVLRKLAPIFERERELEDNDENDDEKRTPEIHRRICEVDTHGQARGTLPFGLLEEKLQQMNNDL